LKVCPGGRVGGFAHQLVYERHHDLQIVIYAMVQLLEQDVLLAQQGTGAIVGALAVRYVGKGAGEMLRPLSGSDAVRPHEGPAIGAVLASEQDLRA
jgi:hypothetical protein